MNSTPKHIQQSQNNADLHGFVPDHCSVALLLIDVINDLEFEGGEKLLPFAEPMALALKKLKSRARDLEIPVLYVNDNLGRWKSDFRGVLDHCLDETVRGHKIVQQLAPDDEDYFVLKPKHSGFYSTSLEILLKHLGAKTLILTGMAGDICVLFTANDAYMRDFEIVVPCDCMASETQTANEHALEIMRTVLKANTQASDELDLKEFLQ